MDNGISELSVPPILQSSSRSTFDETDHEHINNVAIPNNKLADEEKIFKIPISVIENCEIVTLTMHPDTPTTTATAGPKTSLKASIQPSTIENINQDEISEASTSSSASSTKDARSIVNTIDETMTSRQRPNINSGPLSDGLFRLHINDSYSLNSPSPNAAAHSQNTRADSSRRNDTLAREHDETSQLLKFISCVFFVGLIVILIAFSVSHVIGLSIICFGLGVTCIGTALLYHVLYFMNKHIFRPKRRCDRATSRSDVYTSSTSEEAYSNSTMIVHDVHQDTLDPGPNAQPSSSASSFSASTNRAVKCREKLNKSNAPTNNQINEGRGLCGTSYKPRPDADKCENVQLNFENLCYQEEQSGADGSNHNPHQQNVNTAQTYLETFGDWPQIDCSQAQTTDQQQQQRQRKQLQKQRQHPNQQQQATQSQSTNHLGNGIAVAGKRLIESLSFRTKSSSIGKSDSKVELFEDSSEPEMTLFNADSIDVRGVEKH